MNRLLALILLSAALALPALPVHADATGDLFEAAENGTVSEVNAALAAGADIGAHDAFAGRTALHWAASSNSNPAVITALIEGGADPDARIQDGDVPSLWTPLHLAALRDNLSAITALIEGGADPNAREPNHWTPLHYAASPHPSNPSVIKPSVIKALIEGGANPNARDVSGWTPLHRAAVGDNPAVITALIEGGADPGARNEDGYTPLEMTKRRPSGRGTPL